MSMTWKDVKLATLQKMFAAEGSEIPSDESTEDYIAGMPYVANEALQRLSTAGKFITKSVSIAHTPLTNMLDDSKAFAFLSITPSTPYSVTIKGAHSMYFEFSGKINFTVIDNTGEVADEIVCKGSFEQKRLLFDNPDNEEVTVKFESTYPSVIKNIALYEEMFDEPEEVPAYAVKVRYDLKEIVDDFYNMAENQIYYEGGEEPYYIKTTEYYREADNVLLFDRDMPGLYTVYYHAYPPEITVDTEDTYVLPLDRDVVTIMPLYMASELYKDDDISIATAYRNEFELAFESLNDTSDSAGFEQFISESGW